MSTYKLGIIGGSGLYSLPGLDDVSQSNIDTPWGAPSGALTHARLDGLELVFLPRHGEAHQLGPSQVNYRANIDALKRAGVSDIVSLSACGSLKENLAPGSFVVVDQYVDRTFARPKSFFGEGCVAHVAMADPVCPRLSAFAADAAKAAGVIHVQHGGTYLAMEGPQFSTRAESQIYRQWGLDVIGMTNMPEAKLAREAELPYASVCMVTDYDCWRSDSDDVDINAILAVMKANTETAHSLVRHLAGTLAKQIRQASPIDTALDFAILTPPDHRDPKLVAKLDAVAGRVL